MSVHGCVWSRERKQLSAFTTHSLFTRGREREREEDEKTGLQWQGVDSGKNTSGTRHQLHTHTHTHRFSYGAVPVHDIRDLQGVFGAEWMRKGARKYKCTCVLSCDVTGNSAFPSCTVLQWRQHKSVEKHTHKHTQTHTPHTGYKALWSLTDCQHTRYSFFQGTLRLSAYTHSLQQRYLTHTHKKYTHCVLQPRHTHTTQKAL